MPRKESPFRQYILGVVVAVLMALLAFTGDRLYAKVDKLEDQVNASTVSDAVLKKDIDDFHKSNDASFEYLKRLIEHDLAQHHRPKSD